MVYCVENDPIPARSKNFYANISLSKKGGTVTLLSKKGKALDTVELGAQFGNVSWGRVKDGGKWRFLSAVSPGKTNASAGYVKRAEAPAFSASGGFYKKAGKVKLAAEKDAQIRYTLDGSEPTAKSTLYTGAISARSLIRAAASFILHLPPLAVLFENAKASPQIMSLEKARQLAEAEKKKKKRHIFSYVTGHASYSYGKTDMWGNNSSS